MNVLYVFCILVFYIICALQIFSPSLWLFYFFHSTNGVFQRAEVSKFDEVQYTIVFINKAFPVKSRNLCLTNPSSSKFSMFLLEVL